MKKVSTIIGIFLFQLCFSQVGINTTTPQATLDVNGNLIVRTVNSATPAVTYDFLVHNNSTKEVEKFSGNFTTGSTANTTIAKVADSDGISLLSGSLFAGWRKINFSASNISINPGNNFSATSDFYTVPSNGIYKIVFEFRYGTGVLASLLNFNGTPSIGILKHTGGTYTVLDSRKFSGVSVPLLASIIVSNTSIDSIYQLSAGDQLSFEVNDGGLSLNLLSSSYATFYVQKISD